MNAAEQRRLTPGLAVLCLLAAVLLVALLAGFGRGVHWRKPGSPATLPEMAATGHQKPLPLQHFSTVWQQPLFNADRKPVVVSEGDESNVNLGDLHLTGIIITPGLRMALLRDRSGNSVLVQEGSSLPKGGWMLQKLAARSATFSGSGQRKQLKLEVAADIDANAGASQSTPSSKGAHAMHVDSGMGNRQASGRGSNESAHARKPKTLRMRKVTKELKKRRREQQAAQQADGENEKARRIKALKARIQARRQQQQAQKDQGH